MFTASANSSSNLKLKLSKDKHPCRLMRETRESRGRIRGGVTIAALQLFYLGSFPMNPLVPLLYFSPNGAKLLLCFLLPFILNFLYEDSGVEATHNQPGPSVHTMVLLIIILMYVSYVHSYYPKIGQIRIISLYLLYFFNFLFSCLTNSLINTKYRIATRKD